MSTAQQSQPAFGNNTLGSSSTLSFGATSRPAFGAFEGLTKCFEDVYDVAIVKIDGGGSDAFSPAKLGFSGKVRVAELVFTLGYPEGYPMSLTKGIISSVCRTRTEARVRGKDSSYFQTDCPVSKGSSGSPLVNLDGVVIGVIIGRIPEADRITFALPIDTVRQRLSLKGFVV